MAKNHEEFLRLVLQKLTNLSVAGGKKPKHTPEQRFLSMFKYLPRKQHRMVMKAYHFAKTKGWIRTKPTGHGQDIYLDYTLRKEFEKYL